MTAIDLRGFVDDLAPLRRRKEWVLESRRKHLSRLQDQLSQLVLVNEALVSERQVQAQALMRDMQQRPDPVTYQQALLYLAQLNQRIHDSDAAIEPLQCLVREVRSGCMALQRQLNEWGRHREECLKAYQRAEQRRHANERDRDWMARLHWRDLHAPLAHQSAKGGR